MILVLEYSTPVASLAIGDGTQIFSRSWSREKRSGEQLTPNIEALLNEAGLKVSDISKIVVSGGPGSFTGIRLAVSAARALAYVLKTPVALIDSLSAIAVSSEASLGELTVLSNAFGNSVYYASFKASASSQGSAVQEHWRMTKGPLHVPISELSSLIGSKTVVAGDALSELNLLAHPQFGMHLTQDHRAATHPNATKVLHSVLDQGLAFQWKTWETLSPLYIKRSGAEEKHGS